MESPLRPFSRHHADDGGIRLVSTSDRRLVLADIPPTVWWRSQPGRAGL